MESFDGEKWKSRSGRIGAEWQDEYRERVFRPNKQQIGMEIKYDVFISYSRKDYDTAKEIFDALSKAGISCFFDENLDNPDVWDVLVNEIENCKVFLYLGSKNIASARITPKELTYAVNHKDKSCIYPYFIDDFELPKVHEFLLSDINWFKKSKHPINTGLIPDLKNILQQKEIPAPPVSSLTDEVEQFVVGGQVFDMVRIEGGTMTIGSTPEQNDNAESNELPAHAITLPTYYIARFPITQNIWESVMGYNKSQYAKKERYLSKMLSSIPLGSKHGYYENPIVKTLEMSVKEAGVKFGKIALDRTKSILKRTIEKHVFHATDDKGHYPAERLTHDEALEFVRRLSQMTNTKFALPTEEEWEYAARGGQKSQGFKYAGSNDIDEVAWYRDNASGTTHPVGEKKPNELGLYDMSGNVWEWTNTPIHSYANDIEVGGDVFVRRGGSWWHEAKNCRVSRRYASDHFKKTSGLGLRVVIRENIE